MNGIHDMGGMDGFGKVVPEADEPVFYAPWEGRVIAMMRAMGAAGAWNLDMFRDTREHQPPAVYLASSYYKSWGLSIETLSLIRELISPQELADGRPLNPSKPLQGDMLHAETAVAALRRRNYERPSKSPARFKQGAMAETG